MLRSVPRALSFPAPLRHGPSLPVISLLSADVTVPVISLPDVGVRIMLPGSSLLGAGCAGIFFSDHVAVLLRGACGIRLFCSRPILFLSVVLILCFCVLSLLFCSTL